MKIWANGQAIQPKFNPPKTADIGKFAFEERTFKWSGKAKRKVQSKCCAMAFDTKMLSVFFVTLTEKVNIESNKVISKYIENLKARKIMDQYVWVRERQKRGANHYHLLFTSKLDRLDISVMQDAWNSAQKSSGGEPSPNSFRLGERPKVMSIGAVSQYISKYMSKSDKKEKLRLHGSSRGMQVAFEVPVDEVSETLGNPFVPITEGEWTLYARFTADEKFYRSLQQYHQNAMDHINNSINEKR